MLQNMISARIERCAFDILQVENNTIVRNWPHDLQIIV